MEPIVVGAFPKNHTEVVAGEINEYKGKISAHVRVFKVAVDGSFIHTSKGVAVPLPCVPDLRAAVRALGDVLGPNRLTGKVDVGSQQVRVGTRLFNDEMYLDIRRFYESGGEWLPTPKGVMMRPELLPDLIRLVDQLADAATTVATENPTALN